jgi:glycosyltransferase involved in cell wall biosynthesis
VKVLVVNSLAPFLQGGAEELADNLVRNLNLHGAEAEMLRIPFAWVPTERLLEEMMICRNFKLWNVDRVIALRFPAYLVPFPQKTLWLLHQFRQAYDLYDAGQSHLFATERGAIIREAIRTADNNCFAAAQHLYTNSPVTARRLNHYNGFDATILRPPLNDPELFKGNDPGNYIFAGGRINSGKRQQLLLEAMLKVTGSVRLVIAGPPDSPEDALSLQRFLSKHKLADKVTLDFGFLPRQKIADYVNGALACAYLPFDEDSFGYVTMEACHAGKAVITTYDSGGVLDLITNKETGMVCEPTASALADAINRLAADRSLARRLGEAARERFLSLNLTWKSTVERLLS